MHYKMILKNEVPVTSKYLKRLFAEKEVFICGYGSLLYTAGWVDRGMMYIPGKNDLIECIVGGYKRGPFGIYRPYRRGWGNSGIHFYGAVQNENSRLNGVLTKIHHIHDWIGLMTTECIAGIVTNYNYRCVDVTDNICGVKLKKNQVVHMVVNEPCNKDMWPHAVPAGKYYERVAKGVNRERSDEFKKMFYATGGLTSTQARIMYKSSQMKGRR